MQDELWGIIISPDALVGQTPQLLCIGSGMKRDNTNSLSANRFAKIQEKKYISWQYVPTIENCADAGSRGCFGDKLHAAWFTGPSWLTQEELWSKNLRQITTSTPERSSKSKVIRTALKSALTSKDYLYNVIEKFTFRKSMRITLILRFKNNCRNHQHELTGPLSTEEIQAAVNIWIVKLQKKMLDYPQY